MEEEARDSPSIHEAPDSPEPPGSPILLPPSPVVLQESDGVAMFSNAMSIAESDSTSLPVVNVISESERETPKKRRSDEGSDEPPEKIRKVSSPKDDGDGETCPICLDSWGTSGDHRLVALKCGHLFGSRCVEHWLRAQKSCPTCKTKASLRDLKNIYAKRLVAVDTSEITAMQKQVEHLEMELQKSKIAHRACINLLNQLRIGHLKIIRIPNYFNVANPKLI